MPVQTWDDAYPQPVKVISGSVSATLPPSTTGATGELVGVVAATQCPNVPGSTVRLRARATNAGIVYLGFTSGVTKADGATDTTTGFALPPGEETGPMPLDNLNRLYRICDNAGDGLTYMVLV